MSEKKEKISFIIFQILLVIIFIVPLVDVILSRILINNYVIIFSRIAVLLSVVFFIYFFIQMKLIEKFYIKIIFICCILLIGTICEVIIPKKYLFSEEYACAYTINNNQIEICDIYCGNKDYSIPSEIDNIEVSGIRRKAIKNDYIENLYIYNNLYLTSNAIYKCQNLESIYIYSDVALYPTCFNNCPNLKHIIFIDCTIEFNNKNNKLSLINNCDNLVGFNFSNCTINGNNLDIFSNTYTGNSICIFDSCICNDVIINNDEVFCFLYETCEGLPKCNIIYLYENFIPLEDNEPVCSTIYIPKTLTYFPKYFFNNITTVYYNGSEEDWNNLLKNITISSTCNKNIYNNSLKVIFK